MTQPPEHEEKAATPDSRKLTDSKAADNGKAAIDSIPISKAALLLSKLKRIAHYAMLGSPALAVLSLIIAVIAITGNQSGQSEQSLATAKLESINASLSASKIEIEKLKASLAQANAAREEDRKKQDELVLEIIRNVTNLQIKMKVYPTLEEQLIQNTGTARKP